MSDSAWWDPEGDFEYNNFPDEQPPREDYEVVAANAKAIRATDKALLVAWGGKTRWVPKGHIVEESEVKKAGDTGALAVTSWLADRLEEEGDEPEDEGFGVQAVCLRETEKAIFVNVKTGPGENDWKELVIPKSQVLEDSDITGDGDRGILRITSWIAKQKGLVK